MSFNDLQRYLDNSNNLSKNTERLVSLAPTLQDVETVGNVFSVTPAIGRSQKVKVHLPYKVEGAQESIKYISVRNVSMEEENIFKLPASVVDSAQYRKSITEYGEFRGSCFYVTLHISGFSEIGAVELVLGGDARVLAIECGDYSNYVRHRGNWFSCPIPRVASDKIHLLVQVPNPSISCGGYVLFIKEARVYSWSGLKELDTNFEITTPGPCTGITLLSKSLQDSSVFHEFGTEVHKKGIVGFPNILLTSVLPGMNELYLPEGTYEYSLIPICFFRGDVFTSTGKKGFTENCFLEIDGNSYIIGADENFNESPINTPISIMDISKGFAPDFSIKTGSFTLEETLPIKMGLNDKNSTGYILMGLENQSNSESYDFNGTMRMGYKYLFDTDLTLINKFRYDHKNWNQLTTKRYMSKIAVNIDKIKEGPAIDVYVVTEDFKEKFITKTRGGNLVLNIEQEIRGLLFLIPLDVSLWDTIELAPRERKTFYAEKDSWLRIQNATPGTIVHQGGNRCNLTGNFLLSNFSRPVFHSGITEEIKELIQTDYKWKKISTESQEPSYIDIDGTLFSIKSHLFFMLNDSAFRLKISGSSSYSDSTIVEGVESPKFPSKAGGTVVGLCSLNVAPDSNEMALEPVTSTEGVRLLLANPKVYFDGEDYILNAFGFESQSYGWDGVDTQLSSEYIEGVTTEPNGTWYTLFVKQPEPYVSVSLEYEEVMDIEGDYGFGQSVSQTLWANDWTGDPEVVSTVNILHPNQQTECLIPVQAVDLIDIFSVNGCTLEIISGREILYNLVDIKRYANTMVLTTPEKFEIIEEDSENTNKNLLLGFVHFSEEGKKGPRGLLSVYLGKPVLTELEASLIDFDDTSIAFPTPAYLSAQYCRENLDLWIFDKLTGKVVDNSSVRIRWAEGIVELISVKEVRIFWNQQIVPEVLVSQKVEDFTGVKEIITSKTILKKPGLVSVEYSNNSEVSLLTDVTDYRKNTIRTLRGREFQITGLNTIQVGREGTYRVKYSTASRDFVISTRGIRDAELEVNWYEPFGEEIDADLSET